MTPSRLGRRAAAALDELARLLAALDDAEAVAERASIPVRWDGYPTATLMEGSRSYSTDPAGERIAAMLSPGTDREGTPLDVGPDGKPPATSSITFDPVGDGARAMIRALEQAAHVLRAAVAARARAVYVPHDQRPPARPEAPGCVNCERFEVYSVATKAGRCDACYQYLRRSGPRQLERPERLVLDDKPGHRRREHAVTPTV